MICLCLSLTLFTLAKNLTYNNPKLNMIPPLSAPPTSFSGNKSSCNYQAGSITVTSLLSSARLTRLQLTLTCSSLAVHHCYRSASDRSHPVSPAYTHTHTCRAEVHTHRLHTHRVHTHTTGCKHTDRQTWTLANHKHESWTPQGGGQRSQLLLETSLQLSNQQRVTVLSQNRSPSNEMEDKDENHMVSHAV